MKKGKPDVKEIVELVEKNDRIYGATYKNFERDEQFYELDFKSELNLPEEYKADSVVLPTGRDVVDTAVDHTDISHARVFANKKSIHKIDEEGAEMMRKFYHGIIHRTNVESDISPWRVAAKHYWNHGLGVIKTVWDADMWGNKPIKKEGESDDAYASRLDVWRDETELSIPIIIQAIHPANIMPDPYYGGRLYVIERHKQLLYDINKLFPNYKHPEKDSGEEVEYVDYWDTEYRCILVDNEPVIKVGGGVFKHNYGFIPYTLIESGLGNVAIDAKPEKRYVGLLRYILDLLISESRSYSLNDLILKLGALPWGVLIGENAAGVAEISKKFGTYSKLPEGVEIKEMTPQVPPEALNAHLMRTNYFITAHAAPNSVRGLPETGVRSGADRRLMISEAAARYSYSKDAFSNGAAQVLIKCARLLKNVIPGDIRVWAKTPIDEFDTVINKNKMKEPFTCYVEWAPISEEDEYRRQDALRLLVQAGIYTPDFAWTQMSNVDPKKMAKDREKAMLRQSPTFLQLKDQYLGQKFQEALMELETETQTDTEIEMMGGVTQGSQRRMEPPVPNMPVLGGGQDMQNQLRQQRRPVPAFPGQGQGGGGNR